jgi:hypothetical protein
MRVALSIRSAALAAILAQFNGSILRAYTGSRPASLDGSIAGNTLLAAYTMGSPAFGSADTGTATANAITGGVGLANGNVGFVRVLDDDGTTVLADLTVGVGTGEVQFNTLAVTVGVAATITSMQLSAPAGS